MVSEPGLIIGMMPIVDNFALFSLIVTLGVFTQSAAGFAAGLLIIPLMGYSGYGIPEAQTVLLVATIPQNALGLYRFRESLDLGELKLPVALRLIGLPIGFALLCLLDTLPLPQIRQVLGIVILLCVGLLCFIRPRTERKIPLGWTLVAFLSSGFFAGLTGTGGPMMVLWVQFHRWSTEKTRAFLFGMYICYTGPALALLWWKFGDRILAAILSILLLVPVLLVVSNVGLSFGSWLGRARLRNITLALLCVIGLMGLFAT